RWRLSRKRRPRAAGRKSRRARPQLQRRRRRRRLRRPKKPQQRRRNRSLARGISGRHHGDPRAGDTRRGTKDQYRPSRDEILRYIAENPDRAGKREIAKAFALRGDDRVWLKDMLRDLEDEG